MSPDREIAREYVPAEIGAPLDPASHSPGQRSPGRRSPELRNPELRERELSGNGVVDHTSPSNMDGLAFLRRALSSRSAARHAVLLGEVLGPPVSTRSVEDRPS